MGILEKMGKGRVWEIGEKSGEDREGSVFRGVRGFLRG
jgi:hypothetical protein